MKLPKVKLALAELEDNRFLPLQNDTLDQNI